MDSVIGASAYTKNHREALHSTHICRFQVALIFFGEKGIEGYMKGAHHAYQPLILHLLNGDIIHQTRDDGPRPCLLAKVNLLESVISATTMDRCNHYLPRHKDCLHQGAF